VQVIFKRGLYTMKLSISKYILDKPNEFTPKFHWNDGFECQDITRQELAEAINHGKAFAPQYNGTRKKKNFKCSGFLAIDIDEGMSLEQAMADPYIQKHACLIYTTVSHQKDGKGDRFRVVFELPEAMNELECYERTVKALLERFPMVDKSQNHGASMFCGSKDSNHIVLEGTLTHKDVAELVMIYAKPEQKKLQKDFQKYKENPISLDEARRMLNFIPEQQEYEKWRNVCWALLSYFGEEAIELINDWSPDYKTGGNMVEQLYRDNKGCFDIGTVIHYAQKNGYQLPSLCQPKSNLEKAGLLAFKHLFNEGVGYRSINDSLYWYDNGVYQKVEKLSIQKQILSYFKEYYPKYADMRSVKDALGCVVTLCNTDASQVNPSGLNCSNGFLKLIYDEATNQIHPELIEHSPDIFCTYKSAVIYDPEATSTILDKALDEMLDVDHQSILLKNIAASLALPIVRKKHIRAVKLLMLIGEGSNGKDTVREWLSLLYGRHGMTSVSLQAFRDADRGRLFGLAPLSTSRINWSSENVNLPLSDCQSLKAFATGDPFWVEEKNVQGRPLEAQSVALFNVNEEPKFDIQKEAVLSRYGFVVFPYTFKQRPNSQDPNEKLGDPRLKEDSEYIIKNILPALLNRLIVELNNVLKNGIDYAATQYMFQDILESNSHMATFIRESGLDKCPLDQGLLASRIYDIYRSWCEENGFITRNYYSGGYSYTDPSQRDPVIKHANKIKSSLSNFFSGLQTKLNSKGTQYNLSFNIGKADPKFIESLEKIGKSLSDTGQWS
jgi:phage/plasmid-associated DNA primase